MGGQSLPGDPNSPEVDQQATTITTLRSLFHGDPQQWQYEPVGEVPVNEEAAERAFGGEDNELRYHFIFRTTLTPTVCSLSASIRSVCKRTQLTRTTVFEVYFNDVLVQSEVVVRIDNLNQPINTPPFPLAT